ncbi:MAG: serine/threonine-protein kinase [Planctomycetota bacterium]
MIDKDEELLATLLVEWEELRECGQDTPLAELCCDHPHLLDELARRIHILNVTSWMDKPVAEAGDDVEAPASTWGMPRTLIGRYRLDDLVAVGGFAHVWRGYDLELQRTVAIKVPKPNRLESPESFLAEARRVARLKHPGIVPVHDVGREGESCFIVSEFVEGGSLEDHLSRNPPTQNQAIRWVAEIADALEYAHLHGVIHRDIKPANILIDHHNRALLADFGIAQTSTLASRESLSLGTLRYMSPEQLEGKVVDPRSDIFSLGVVLYETFTGKLPYSSSEPNVLRREIADGVIVGTGDLPPELKTICDKALAHGPHRRHVSAAQLGAELLRYLDVSAASTKPLMGWKVWGTIALASAAILCWAIPQTALFNQPLNQAVRPQEAKNEKALYWLNTDSKTRHNEGCEHFQKTKSGRLCGPDEGKPCRVCGG